MQVKFVKHPKNDVLPPRIIGESVLYELSSSFNESPNSKYWLRCHKCGMSANLGSHEVTIDNGIITISPSIMCPIDGCGAHYFIKNGEVTQ